MSFALRGLMFLGCAAAVAVSQQPSPEPPRAGLEANWDIAGVFEGIGAHAAKMLPALDRINAREWMQKGAPETFAVQLQSSKDQARTLAESAKLLARYPDQLSASLEVYFRIQGLETMIASLAEGVRKYQSPAAAQSLISLAAENGANRDHLQKYLVNLAAAREQDLKVMDREAQRCRGMQIGVPQKTGKKK